MRRLLWLLLAAAAGVLAATVVAGQPGYLLLAWGIGGSRFAACCWR